jgi:heat shock protein HslJ
MSQRKPKKNLKDIKIPFQVVNGYFVKNTFTKDQLDKAKITTQKEFDEIFGAAAFMGENGMPTSINFKQQYVIAVIEKVTDLNTTITPVSLKKISKTILFEYRTVKGEKQSFSIQPLTIIIVDKKYTGKVETVNSQIPTENSKIDDLTRLNSQWIIEYFNNPERIVQTKSSYINIDAAKGSFGGNDGCNTLRGKVNIKGKTISFQNIISTKMTCENMDQGAVFVNNLKNINKFEIRGGELFLYKNEILIMTLESFR